jgi:hypothetical protein
VDDFSYVLGVCLSDAYLQKQRARDTRVYKKPRPTTYITKHWITLKCKDRSFAERFANAIAMIRGRPVAIYRSHHGGFATSTIRGLRKDYVWEGFLVSLTYKDLWLKLKPAQDAIRAGTYDWPPDVIPEDVLLGVIDGDGSVHKQGHITIGTIYPQAISDLCHRAGIASRSYSYTHQTVPTVVIKKSLAVRFDTIKRRS